MRKKKSEEKSVFEWTTSSILWNDLWNSHGHRTSVAIFYWQYPPTHIPKNTLHVAEYQKNMKILWSSSEKVVELCKT